MRTPDRHSLRRTWLRSPPPWSPTFQCISPGPSSSQGTVLLTVHVLCFYKTVLRMELVPWSEPMEHNLDISTSQEPLLQTYTFWSHRHPLVANRRSTVFLYPSCSISQQDWRRKIPNRLRVHVCDYQLGKEISGLADTTWCCGMRSQRHPGYYSPLSLPTPGESISV